VYRRFLRWPLLPLLIIGIVNIAPWYGYVFYGVDRRIALPVIVALAFAAGWFTHEKLWGTVVIMLAATMFLGGPRHGHPWQWLIYGFMYPVMLAYFALEMGPIIQPTTS
jgi:hypothetical protein